MLPCPASGHSIRHGGPELVEGRPGSRLDGEILTHPTNVLGRQNSFAGHSHRADKPNNRGGANQYGGDYRRGWQIDLVGGPYNRRDCGIGVSNVTRQRRRFYGRCAVARPAVESAGGAIETVRSQNVTLFGGCKASDLPLAADRRGVRPRRAVRAFLITSQSRQWG